MASLRDLEEQGSGEIGVSMQPAQQTTGGSTNLLITRRYKVRSADATDYLFQIVNASPRITDPNFSDAYLVFQSIAGLDQANGILTCRFAQIPQTWNEPVAQAVTFPGVSPSSLYAARDFPFRTGPVSITTQTRYQHSYFLGPPTGIPTWPRFQPVDAYGSRVSVLDDWTIPSSDEWLSMTAGRQEIVVDSIPILWMGDIYDLRTLWAVCQ